MIVFQNRGPQYRLQKGASNVGKPPHIHTYIYIYVFGGFPKKGVPFLGVPVVRIIVFWGPYWGPVWQPRDHAGANIQHEKVTFGVEGVPEP